ncbi:energy-coupling factor transporter transmembrane component T family protein [Comamonas aquatica]|jgi:biotin transport system permease protein|uniref:energy-coupling factor transporter transmembrane component T family protein n=1 Tax=Comamonas aquatica TaxID=225991 RepID=UPI0021B115EB|nr:energy-coupling factor transporter transmembrane protein EcfT [Comamonas aquatica]
MGTLYSEHHTWLHRLRPGLKLGLMAVLSTVLFLLQAPWALALCALGCAVLWFSLGAATRVARRLIASVLIAAALIAVFHAVMGHYALATVSALRLACASTLGVALTVSTHPTQLLQLLEQLLAPLGRLGFPSERFALQLALMLRFIEHFFVQWKRLDEAHRLRTGKGGGIRLLAPLSIQMLQTARRVADALYARLGQ